MKHIVFYSGGLGSWMTAKRVIERYGKENVILLFTDTLMEDEDLYRFLDDTEKDFGIEITRIADGRDVWEVFRDVRFIGNSKIAPCSHVLKQKKSKEWIKEHFTPDECILYLGIDWTEEHRTKAPRKNWSPYRVEYPMCEEPYLTKIDVVKELEKTGIERPRLYEQGFAHNNCGGFCVRGGQGHFIQLLEKNPERYAYHEQKELDMREFLGKDYTILTRVRNGEKQNITLKELREEYEREPKQIDMFDVGGCGCFVDDGVVSDEV